jgi:hypothetical protein
MERRRAKKLKSLKEQQKNVQNPRNVDFFFWKMRVSDPNLFSPLRTFQT